MKEKERRRENEREKMSHVTYKGRNNSLTFRNVEFFPIQFIYLFYLI